MSDPELSPEQEDQVRALLASARHETPIPPDVAQRLDRVLGQLGEAGDAAPVVDLAARRHRRRTAGQLLVAAAAVVAVGFGIAHLDRGSSGGTAADSSTVASRDANHEARSHQPGDSPSSGAGGGASLPSPNQAATGVRGSLPVAVRSQRFGRDVRAAMRTAEVDGLPASADTNTLAGLAKGWSCASADYGTGTLVPILYDGTAAVLVVGPARGGELPVQVLACGTADVLRSATLPSR